MLSHTLGAAMPMYRVAEADDEYAKLIRRMYPPRVELDNQTCDTATVIKVHSMNRHGILLEVVQVLTDAGLVVTKAHMASDGEWFMHVFNVTDDEGNKILDRDLLATIEKSIIKESCIQPVRPRSCWSEDDDLSQPSSSSSNNGGAYTTIELTGADRPGLLSEVCAVLATLDCNVVRAELWTHNCRAAALVQVTDALTGCGIRDDQDRLSRIRELLCNVLKAGGADDHHNPNHNHRNGKMRVSDCVVHTERRLHQLMYEDRDYECCDDRDDGGYSNSRLSWTNKPEVELKAYPEKFYTSASIKCKDRPKLLFDTLCTLTDMQYVVYHGNVHTGGDEATLEYFIRHVDGLPISSEAERQRVIQCLEASIERRAWASEDQGVVELELRTDDRVGLLSTILRVFRENGLYVKRAVISTVQGKAVDTFHVSDMCGAAGGKGALDAERIGYIRRQIGEQAELRVVDRRPRWQREQDEELLRQSSENETASTSPAGFLFGCFLRACSFQNFRMIRSYS